MFFEGDVTGGPDTCRFRGRRQREGLRHNQGEIKIDGAAGKAFTGPLHAARQVIGINLYLCDFMV